MDSRLIIIALVAYLLGSIPFGYILVKLFLKQDIRATGSGNIGATNVARSGNKGLAIATLLLDAGKGALAVIGTNYARNNFFHYNHEVVDVQNFSMAANIYNPMFLPAAIAALFAILGHCFPVWLKFKGGKGVATAIGAFLFVAPGPAILCMLVFGLTFALSRYVSVSSICAAFAFPIIAGTLQRELATLQLITLFTISSSVLILKHHANIRRLIAGTEPKFGKKAIGTHDPIQTEKSI